MLHDGEGTAPPFPDQGNVGALRTVLILAVVFGVSLAAYFFWPREAPVMPHPAATPAAPRAPAGPKFPVPAEAGVVLPALAQSDAAMVEALSGLLGGLDAVARLLNVEGFVRNVVATIDNLPREVVASRLNPLRPIGGAFVTQGRDESLAIGARNAARYEPYLRVMESVPPERAAAAYRHFHPLFQQAYVELGYPDGHFNDRLVEVIDHLLSTPEVPATVRLTQPHVLYEYADPDLEERSAGQKALMRMGNAQAARVKAWLLGLRGHITAGVPAGKIAG
jgi:hypothetical protein